MAVSFALTAIFVLEAGEITKINPRDKHFGVDSTMCEVPIVFYRSQIMRIIGRNGKRF